VVVVILTFMSLAFRNVTSAPLDNLNVVAETLARDLKRGDVIVALGAGDVNKVLRLIQQQVAVRSIALETPQ